MLSWVQDLSKIPSVKGGSAVKICGGGKRGWGAVRGGPRASAPRKGDFTLGQVRT